MIPLTTLYDDYIDRPKLTEQKKPIWVYSSSLPTNVGVGTIKSKQTNVILGCHVIFLWQKLLSNVSKYD